MKKIPVPKRAPKPMAKPPEYRGEVIDRTSIDKEKRLCDRCSLLATHRAQREVDGALVDFHFCQSHAEEEVRHKRVLRIAILPKYRLYLSHLRKWNEQQEAHKQGEMF